MEMPGPYWRKNASLLMMGLGACGYITAQSRLGLAPVVVDGGGPERFEKPTTLASDGRTWSKMIDSWYDKLEAEPENARRTGQLWGIGLQTMGSVWTPRGIPEQLCIFNGSTAAPTTAVQLAQSRTIAQASQRGVIPARRRLRAGPRG